MSKGLESLSDLRLGYCGSDEQKERAYSIIEKELKRLEELEKAFDSLSKENEKIMKELSKEIEKNRAFEIIKEKKLVKNGLLTDMTLEQYNWCALKFSDKTLTQEEYDLLKEVLL